MAHRPIHKSKVEDVVGLTPMQEGMLYHYLRNPGDDQFFEQFSYTLKSKLDLSAWMQAWNWIIRQNAMLRTVFRWEKIQNPVQIVLRERLISASVHDLTFVGEDEKETALQGIKQSDLAERFDLAEGPLFRTAVIKLEEEKYVMMVSHHHIIFDGWSNGIILGEFIQAYEAFRSSVVPEAAAKPDFKDYIDWLREKDKHGPEQYWRSYLQGYEFRPTLRKDNVLHIEPSSKACASLTLPKSLVHELEAVSQEIGVTVSSIYTSAWGVLLQLYSKRSDVLFGTTVSGRSGDLREVERIVGMLMNTIPVRIRAQSETTLKDIILDTQQAVYKRQEYETTPLVDIQSYSKRKSTEELFDTLLVIENYPLDFSIHGELQLTSFDGYSATNYSLLLAINPFEETTIHFIYDQQNYEADTIELLQARYVGLLKLITANSECPVQHIEALTEAEKKFHEVWNIDFNYEL
ncbi:condensation domain-containing protein [Paenibacillus macquariensis]|uniref:Condensation domain-containing protein n=1 Tax=Paenibacillus macquariensis TaxID=948756 RepID=A0ABY1K2L1_9BACL|nr:condensation domain-containing protein [Paenibacillus macquariensis]MEC0090196.1 condensation domain-containing protein [Paenibacillus macquariensis]OAB39569.1 hypothetical protein PMSM_00085 [Paenibacillus macquariensis subsp. macquariensis]SIR17173.1 Condensation domain-containing protein [Paenibacillus macquariensis]